MQNNETSAQDTFPRLLEAQVRARGNRPALRRKIYGIWHTWTWAQTADEIKTLAGGLAAIGFKRGDKLAIIGDNRPRFFFAMTAAQALGGVPVPMYPDASADEVVQILNNADIRFAIVQDQEQVDRLIEVKDRCPKFQETISIDTRGLHDYDRAHLRIYTDVEATGRKYLSEHPNFYAEQVAKGKAEDTAILLFTSGTTGSPKAVMFTHKNMIAIGRIAVEQKKLDANSDTLAIMPLSTTTTVLTNYIEPMIAGFCVNCPESSQTAFNDIREIGPRYVVAPPHVFTYIYNLIMVKMEDASFIKRWMFDFFMRHASPMQVFGWLFIYGPLKNTMGLGRIRTAFVSGDFISERVFEFYRSLNIPLRQFYGPTEGFSFVTIQPESAVRSNTVGTPTKNTEIKFADKGEILFKSPGVFQGYYNDAQGTADVKTSDGWIRTGDVGELDKDGQLIVTGRLAHTVKLKNGNPFVPKSVENSLKSFPQIKDAVAIGSEKDYVTALININAEVVGKWADRKALIYSGYAELASLDEVSGLIKVCVEKTNRDLANAGEKGLQIKRFAILNKELSANDGELTRSRKLRRSFIGQRYQKLVDAIYSGGKAFSLEVQAAEAGGHAATFADIKISDAQTV